MKKFGDFICKHTKLIVIISAILLVFSIIGSSLTKINYDILVYLPEDIETVQGQNILTDDFNMGAYSIAVIENMNAKDILKLEEDIKDVENVNKVLSLYDVIGTSIPVEMLPSKIQNKLHQKNTDLLFITFDGSTSSEETINAVDEIRSITSDNVKLGGMSSMVLDTMNLSQKEIFIYIVIAVILCILVLELSLDNYLAPILLLLNIGFAILLNLGTNLFLGEISYITKALVAVLQLGVTTDFSIFLYHSYQNKKEEYDNKLEAMSKAIQETFISVTGSSLTTIAGFLVLCTMSLTLGKDLGIVMAKGVLLGVISVLTLFPSLLLLFDNILEKTKHKVFIPNFTKLNNFIVNHNKIILVLFTILLIPMYLAYSKVEVYYKIDRSLPKTLESIASNSILKEKFNIVSPEIILLNKNVKNDDVLNLVNELESVEGIDFVLSYSKIKEKGITEEMISKDLVQVFENDKYQMLLVNSLYEVASDELNEQVGVINKIVKKYDSNSIVAGEGPLMKDLIKVSDSDFKNVNVSSVICIFIILFIVLKSISLPFLLIVTIEFAIFTNMGISYFNGTVLPFVAPIVLGTIQLGATIDYAILMTTTYLENRKNNINKKEAMIKTLNYSGNSIFVSGMCFFAATFGVGLYSKLEMVGYLCTLISRGAIISMIVVISVLPSILLMFDKLIIKTTLNTRKEKNMKNKNKIIKNACVWIVLINIVMSVLPIKTYAISKNETVYTKLNSDGSVKNVLVNEQIINTNNNDKIEDYTILENILNIGNDNTYTQNGNKITWNNKKKDILYQGTTNKELPISINVTYKLNDKEYDVNDIIGKSGKIEINLKFTNNDKHVVKVNNKSETLYTPFVVAVGTMIDSENNSNIYISNGKVVNNGTSNIVIGLSSPGLYDSLKIKELKNMDNITISYDTTNFELSSIYTVISSKILDISDLDIFDKMDTLYNSIDSLQTNMDKLEDGAKQLSCGITNLNNTYYRFNMNLGTINSNLKTLNSGVNELTSGVNTILNNEYVSKFRSYLPTLEENARKISNISNKYADNMNKYLDNSDKVVDSLTNDILNIIYYLDNVENYIDNNNNYQNSIIDYNKITQEYITKIDNYLDIVENYINTLHSISSFTNSASSYIIDLYNENPDGASSELTRLYNEAIDLQNNTDLQNMSNTLNIQKQSIKELKDSLNIIENKINTITESLNEKTSELLNNIEDIKQVCTKLDNTESKIKEINNNIHLEINTNREKLNNNVKNLNELPDKINKLSNGIDEFENGINKINDSTNKISNGLNTITVYSNQIYNGMSSIKDGAEELSLGISTYNKEGINKLTSLINNNVKSVVKKVETLSNLSKEYDSFAGKDSIDGETKFILVIDGIESNTEESTPTKTEKKVTIWDRIKGLFK